MNQPQSPCLWPAHLVFCGILLVGPITSGQVIGSGNIGGAAGSTVAPPSPDIQTSIGRPQDSLGFSISGNGGKYTVGNVAKGGLAGTAGLQSGDRILAIDKSWIQSNNDISNRLRSAVSKGEPAWVYVERGGAKQWVKFSGPAASESAKLGIDVSDEQGALKIINVASKSTAAEAGLKAGDEVLAINGRKVTSFNDLAAQVAEAGKFAESIKVSIRREGQKQEVVAKMKAGAALSTLRVPAENLPPENSESVPAKLQVLRLQTTELRVLLKEATPKGRDSKDAFSAALERLSAVEEDVRLMSSERGDKVSDQVEPASAHAAELMTLVKKAAAKIPEADRAPATAVAARVQELQDTLKTMQASKGVRVENQTLKPDQKPVE